MILNKKLVIKLAKKNELKKIQNFLKLNYKKKHILSQNTKIFKWYYFRKKINCTLAFIKKKIVGIYLFIPLSHFDVNRLGPWFFKGLGKNGQMKFSICRD